MSDGVFQDEQGFLKCFSDEQESSRVAIMFALFSTETA